jgi:hypothetical protein
VKGPQRGSQHPAYQRPPTTKDIRRQRATTPIFIQERAPQGGTKAYQQMQGTAVLTAVLPGHTQP